MGRSLRLVTLTELSGEEIGLFDRQVGVGLDLKWALNGSSLNTKRANFLKSLFDACIDFALKSLMHNVQIQNAIMPSGMPAAGNTLLFLHGKPVRQHNCRHGWQLLES